MRALYYFYLARIFGDILKITESQTELRELQKTRSPVKEIYDEIIIPDLLAAEKTELPLKDESRRVNVSREFVESYATGDKRTEEKQFFFTSYKGHPSKFSSGAAELQLMDFMMRRNYISCSIKGNAGKFKSHSESWLLKRSISRIFIPITYIKKKSMATTSLFLRIIFAAALSLALKITAPVIAQSKVSEKPNVIIILADDLGYGDISSNNPMARVRTPNIDELGKTGIRFTDAHSGGAVCTPSRYGLLTGRYFFRAPRKKAPWGYLPPVIEPGRETIGSLMQKAGYTTACIGKWHLGLDWAIKDPSKPQIPNGKDLTYTNTDFTRNVSGGPNSIGFDYSFILPGSLDMPPYVYVKNSQVTDPDIILTADAYPGVLDKTVYRWDRKYTGENDIYWGRGVWWRNGEMSRSFRIENCFDELVDEGISFIRDQAQNNPSKPFMLYLPLTGPHTPWVPNERFKGKSEMGTYGDFISQVDNVVHQISETLRSLKIEDNTLLIFSSDNGAHWAEEDVQNYAHQANWNKRGQKGDIWDGGHHVPLFVKWPSRIRKAGVYNHTVSLNDIIATFSEMTGQPISGNYGEDSFSFFRVLEGNYRHPVRESIIYLSSAGKLAIKKDEWKFIDCLGSGGFTSPSSLEYVEGGPKGQLYNLDQDPLESTNLYLQEASKVKELSGLLDRLKSKGFSR